MPEDATKSPVAAAAAPAAKGVQLRRDGKGASSSGNEETVMKSFVFEIIRAQVATPDGKAESFDIVASAPASRVVLMDGDSIILVEQFRQKVGQKGDWGRTSLEVPGGKIDAEKGEAALAGAQKEILEEAGYKGMKMVPLLDHPLVKDAGLGPGTVYYFVASGEDTGQTHPEPTESIKVKRLTLAQAVRMVDIGEINDLMTAFAIIYYDNLRRREKEAPNHGP